MGVSSVVTLPIHRPVTRGLSGGGVRGRNCRNMLSATCDIHSSTISTLYLSRRRGPETNAKGTLHRPQWPPDPHLCLRQTSTVVRICSRPLYPSTTALPHQRSGQAGLFQHLWLALCFCLWGCGLPFARSVGGPVAYASCPLAYAPSPLSLRLVLAALPLDLIYFWIWTKSTHFAIRLDLTP